MEEQLYVVMGSDLCLLYTGPSYVLGMQVAGNSKCLVSAYTAQCFNEKAEGSTEGM